MAAISAVLTGMGGINAGLFIKPMSEDLGLSQATFGWAQSARMLGFGISGWLTGRLLDRHGARIPLALAGLLIGLTLVGLAYMQEGWHLIALYLVMGLSGLQGAGGNLYSRVTVSRWFVRKRGRALSLAFIGTPIGILVAPALSQFLIDEVGWRDAWLILGISGGLLVAGISLLVVRRQPEDLDLLPDGDTAELPDGTSRPAHRPEDSWTREEAIRTSAFWRLASVDGFRMVSVATMGVFRVPFFIDRGLDPGIVALALSAEAFVGVPAAMITGNLADRLSARHVAAATTSIMVSAFVLTMLVNSVPVLFAATLLWSTAAASFNVSQTALWPRYFGSAHIGAISGLSMLMGLALGAIGAPLTGFIYDWTGGYEPAWYAATVGLAIATLIVLTTKRPVRRTPQQEPAASEV